MGDRSEFLTELEDFVGKHERVAAGDEDFFDAFVFLDVMNGFRERILRTAVVLFAGVVRIVFAKTKTTVGEALGSGHEDDAIEVHALEARDAGFHHAREGPFQADGIEFARVGEVLFGDRGVLFDLLEQVVGEAERVRENEF